MQIHKSSSSRHWKNGRLVDGIDITGGVDITTGVDINNKSLPSPKAYIKIHDPVKHTTEKLTTEDILSYFKKRKGNKSLKKRLQSLQTTRSRKKKKKTKKRKTKNQISK